MLDLERGARMRVTSNPQADRGAVWSPDGASIVFDAHREGGRAIYEKRSGRGASREDAAGRGRAQRESHRLVGGRPIHHLRAGFVHRMRLGRLGAAEVGRRRAVPLTRRRTSTSTRPCSRRTAAGSPTSRSSPVLCEVVVQSFADPAAGKWQISANGGLAPRWSPDGRELYYFDGTDSIVRVEVATEPAFRVGKAGSRLGRTRAPFGGTSLATVSGCCEPPAS